MSDEPIDLDKRRRERQEKLNGRDAALYMCECGCGIFRCWNDGIVECLNCGAAIDGLWVTEG